MSWSNRNLWLVLAGIVALTAWLLTRWITHVNYGADTTVSVRFDERPAYRLERLVLGLAALRRQRPRIPVAAFTGRGNALFLVTPTTRSIALGDIRPSDVSCGYYNGVGGSARLLAGAAKNETLTPIPIEERARGAIVPIPDGLHRSTEHAPDAAGAVACRFHRELAASPTFTERALTVIALTPPGGAVLVDVSALHDLDDLRFSGGLQLPFGGDRTRLLYGDNNVVSVEWNDVSALEQRDIILVLIGALSAIAAATTIEAIRPLVERKSKSG